MKKLNKKVLAGVGLGAVALVGGSFAYYNQTVSLENPLNTGEYNNELVEEFTPPTDEMKPGATIAKAVGARNTGDYPVLVRIRMDETWKRADGAGIITEIINQSSDDYDSFELNTTGAVNEYITNQQWDDADGDVTNAADEFEGSVVRKNLNAANADNWLYNSNDGYWYYYDILQPEGDADGRDKTGNFLDSITLATNVDLGLYETKDYYYVGTAQPAANSTDWKLYTVVRDETTGVVEDVQINGASVGDLNDDGFKDAIDMAQYLNVGKNQKLFRKNESLLNEDHEGYANANYTLTMTSEFVQATPSAIEGAFGSIALLPQAIQDIYEELAAQMPVEPSGN